MGDSVYLKLQPYVQSSLAPRANHKLAFNFFGPYQVIAKVGPVAYKLQLPPTSSIHNVFHVSQLKQALPKSGLVSPFIPNLDDTCQFPEQILAKKMVPKGVNSIQRVLVKWSAWPASLATWEDMEALRQRFPAAPAWGQAGPLHGGDVSTTNTSTSSAEPGPRRSLRPKVPSVRVSGPAWERPV